MGELRSLEVLYLGESGLEVRNNLSGKIPERWSGMTSLTRLSLSGNNLIKGAFPRWLCATRLEELTVAGARSPASSRRRSASARVLRSSTRPGTSCAALYRKAFQNSPLCEC